MLYGPECNTYLLVFRDGMLSRVLGHIRRFGELETGLSLFEVCAPCETADGAEEADVFAGLSPAEIDQLILQQREWTNVFLQQNAGVPSDRSE